jgi:hypothetical protein
MNSDVSARIERLLDNRKGLVSIGASRDGGGRSFPAIAAGNHCDPVIVAVRFRSESRKGPCLRSSSLVVAAYAPTTTATTPSDGCSDFFATKQEPNEASAALSGSEQTDARAAHHDSPKASGCGSVRWHGPCSERF